MPIIFDELADSDVSVANIITQDAAEGIGLKMSKNGGLTQGRRQRNMCSAPGLVMSVQYGGVVAPSEPSLDVQPRRDVLGKPLISFS